MFYSLRGKLIHTEPGIAVIDCNGVGYKCYITMNTASKLPKLFEDATLYTYLNVREDAMDLYGFSSNSELNCFKMLISVSGVGAKMGLSILSELMPEQVAVAIASNDAKTLTKASGVGNKLAQRIILELKDKIKKDYEKANDNNSSYVNLAYESSCSNIAGAISALTVLGYSSSDVMPVLSKLDCSLPVEELIRLSLKAMAGGMK